MFRLININDRWFLQLTDELPKNVKAAIRFASKGKKAIAPLAIALPILGLLIAATIISLQLGLEPYNVFTLLAVFAGFAVLVNYFAAEDRNDKRRSTLDGIIFGRYKALFMPIDHEIFRAIEFEDLNARLTDNPPHWKDERDTLQRYFDEAKGLEAKMKQEQLTGNLSQSDVVRKQFEHLYALNELAFRYAPSFAEIFGSNPHDTYLKRQADLKKSMAAALAKREAELIDQVNELNTELATH